MHTYLKSKTKLACDGWESHLIHPTCGVKHGDPLSPIIFILAMEKIMDALPKDVGVRVGHLKINIEAFADDIVFFASTRKGLQETIDISTDYLSKCGLHVNPNECFTVSIEGLGKRKKTAVDITAAFTCQG